jgi:glycosidase
MNAAMSMYIDMGIDAVRIDTLKHMPREEVISMVSTWQAKKPGMFVFGEALIKGFGDNTPTQLLPWYYTRTSGPDSKSGDSGISVLDFSLMSTFRDNVSKGGLNGLADVFNRFDNDYADATKLVTFFQNHDLTPDNSWSGNGAQHCCTDRKNSALAYNVLWTVRGIPVMYAGDETGARVGLPPDLVGSNDLVKTTGRLYIGDSLDNGDPIIGHITDLNAIRKSSKALQRGKLKVLNHDPLIFERTYENEKAIVAIVGSGGGTASVSGATDGSYVDVVTGQKYTVSGGSVNLGSIPGSSMRVLIKDYSGGKVAGKSDFLK